MKIDFNIIPNRLTDRIDTDSLQTAISRLRDYLETKNPARGLAKKIDKTLRRLARELIRTKVFNQRITVKWNMLHDGAWRRDVLADLGGEPALQTWERRKAKADVTIIEPRVPVHKKIAIEAKPQAEAEDKPKRTKIKTDRDGLFRLAPIAQNIRPLTWQDRLERDAARTYRKIVTVNKPRKAKARPLAPCPPIPLTPGELRGETLERRTGTWEEINAQMDAEDLAEIKAIIAAPARFGSAGIHPCKSTPYHPSGIHDP